MVQGALPHLNSTPLTSVAENESSSSISQLASGMLKDLRSWKDFTNIHRFSKPESLSGPTPGSLQTRITSNLVYFKTNYLIIVAILTAFILFTNWVFLITVLIIGAGYFILERFPENMSYSLFGRLTLSKRQLIYAWAIVSGILLLFTSAGSSIFWLFGISGFVVGLHAALREAEFLDSGEFAPLEQAA